MTARSANTFGTFLETLSNLEKRDTDDSGQSRQGSVRSDEEAKLLMAVASHGGAEPLLGSILKSIDLPISDALATVERLEKFGLIRFGQRNTDGERTISLTESGRAYLTT